MRWCVGVCVAAALWGCGGDGTTSEDDPERFVEQQHEWPYAINVQLDLLLVVDTSSSMAGELAGLEASLRDMAAVLETITPCKPSAHIAVVSADLGAGPHEVLGCTPGGDGGAFHAAPRLAGCNAPADPFLRDVVLDDGTPEANFDGTLADALACIGSLPAGACDIPQPLEAMRRALDDSNPGNAGFRRPDAFLMVVFITDADDCSAADTDLFDPAATALGPLTPFRCFESGVECIPDDPRTPGSKSGCGPRGDSSHLHELDSYKSFLSTVATERDVIVAIAIGGTEPIAVELDDDGNPSLATSCAAPPRAATPAVRLQAFADQFPSRNYVASVCADNIADVLTPIADRPVSVTGVPCLQGNLVDTDAQRDGVQPECAVTELRYTDSGTFETVIPRCDNETDPEASSATPCYLIFEEPLLCPDTPTGLTLDIYPDRTCLPGVRRVSARCVAA